MIQTRYCTLPSAEICRMNGWQVGSILVGRREGERSSIIIITAIGEHVVIARRLSSTHECPWCFAWQDWQKIA